jgi:hypothetical protein
MKSFGEDFDFAENCISGRKLFRLFLFGILEKTGFPPQLIHREMHSFPLAF